MSYLKEHYLFHTAQSEFRKNFSIKTVLVKATNDIHLILDGGGVAALILLDLSSAFDTTSCATLLKQMAGFGVN